MPTELSPTILVVEDDPTIRNLILTTLDTQGFRHLSESTGRGAIAASASSTPDVASSSISASDIDGMSRSSVPFAASRCPSSSFFNERGC